MFSPSTISEFPYILFMKIHCCTAHVYTVQYSFSSMVSPQLSRSLHSRKCKCTCKYTVQYSLQLHLYVLPLHYFPYILYNVHITTMYSQCTASALYSSPLLSQISRTSFTSIKIFIKFCTLLCSLLPITICLQDK